MMSDSLSYHFISSIIRRTSGSNSLLDMGTRATPSRSSPKPDQRPMMPTPQRYSIAYGTRRDPMYDTSINGNLDDPIANQPTYETIPTLPRSGTASGMYDPQYDRRLPSDLPLHPPPYYTLGINQGVQMDALNESNGDMERARSGDQQSTDLDDDNTSTSTGDVKYPTEYVVPTVGQGGNTSVDNHDANGTDDPSQYKVPTVETSKNRNASTNDHEEGSACTTFVNEPNDYEIPRVEHSDKENTASTDNGNTNIDNVNIVNIEHDSEDSEYVTMRDGVDISVRMPPEPLPPK